MSEKEDRKGIVECFVDLYIQTVAQEANRSRDRSLVLKEVLIHMGGTKFFVTGNPDTARVEALLVQFFSE